LRDGDFALAERLYRELLNKNIHGNDARLGLSLALLKQRNLQEAYDHVARVLLAEPMSARAHSLLGAVVLASGDFRESIEEFRTALSIDEDDARAIAGLAMVDFYENRLDSSVRGLRRAVALAPSEPDYIFDLAQAAARTERYREAADAYERFLAIAPKTDQERRDRIRGLIEFLRYLGKQNALYESTGSNRTVVSFQTVENRPTLMIKVNGDKTPLRFVLDTGSGMSVISEETAKRLGLRPVARGGLARAVGGGGRFEIVYGFLSSVDIGDVRVENVPVYIRRFFDSGIKVDGYLGLAIISKFVASLDYRQNQFLLTKRRQADYSDLWNAVVRPDSAGVPPRATQAFDVQIRTTSSGFLSGEVQLEGVEKRQNFIIDTGASVTVISNKLLDVDQVSSFAQLDRMRVYGAAGIADNVTTLVLPRVNLGGAMREKINAAVLDLEPVNETAGFRQSGILGGNFLRHFRVTFDFQRGVIHLEPADQTVNAGAARPDQM